MHSREFTPIPDNPLLSQSLLYDGIILVGGVGVDMFPFTEHVESVVLMQYCGK